MAYIPIYMERYKMTDEEFLKKNEKAIEKSILKYIKDVYDLNVDIGYCELTRGHIDFRGILGLLYEIPCDVEHGMAVWFDKGKIQIGQQGEFL